jgi:hypothetical protein
MLDQSCICNKLKGVTKPLSLFSSNLSDCNANFCMSTSIQFSPDLSFTNVVLLD